MEIAKLTSKGQITIPKAVREDLGVATGDKLIFVPCEGGYLVSNGASFSANVSGEALSEAVSQIPARERPAVKASYYYDDEEDGDFEEKPKKKKDKEKDKKKKKKKK